MPFLTDLGVVRQNAYRAAIYAGSSQYMSGFSRGSMSLSVVRALFQ